MAGYPVDNEYLHNEEQYGKGSSIGGDRSNSDLLSVMAGAGSVAFLVIVSIVFPVLGIPLLVICILVALGKASEFQDDLCNRRKRKQIMSEHRPISHAEREEFFLGPQGPEMPLPRRRPMDEMF